MIEPETQIEPTEEFSAILDNPKERQISPLEIKYTVLEQEGKFTKKPFEEFPEFVRKQTEVANILKAEYSYGEYLKQAEPLIRVEVDFPKEVLYQQSYVISVSLLLYPASEAKEYIIGIEDRLNNWLFYGETKYKLSLSKEQKTEVKFNVIPISVGEFPLPKMTIQPKKTEKNKEKVGRKPMLTIHIEEVHQESEALSEEKVDRVFINSQIVQVFNNATTLIKTFSLISDKF